MRHDLFSIYNKVARDIRDVKFQKVTRQEYLTAAGEIALEISMKSRMFTTRKVFTAIGGQNTILVRSHHSIFFNFRELRAIWDRRMYKSRISGGVTDTEYDSITWNGSGYDFDYNQNYDLMSLIYNLDALLPYTQYAKVINYDMFKPLYILKAVRKNTQCREYSWDAIESEYRGGSPFKINRSDLGYNAYSVRKLNGDSHYYGLKNITSSLSPVVSASYPVGIYVKPNVLNLPIISPIDPGNTDPMPYFDIDGTLLDANGDPMDWSDFYNTWKLTPEEPNFSTGTLFTRTDDLSGWEVTIDDHYVLDSDNVNWSHNWIISDDNILVVNPLNKPTMANVPVVYNESPDVAGYSEGNDVGKLSESMLLTFATDFDEGEEVTIDFAVQMPIHSELHQLADNNYTDADDFSTTLPGYAQPRSTPLWTEFDDHTVIPDILEMPFYAGMRKAIITKLFYQEGGDWGNKLVFAEREYEKELNKLASYQRGIKDLSSFIEIQPYNYLPED